MVEAVARGVATPSGYSVPVTRFAGREGAPVIIVMAALGMGSHFYAPLARAMAATGFNVALVEQRGQGDSTLRPSRHDDWGFAEVLCNDLPAVISWARGDRAAVYLMGHSLGGHYVAMAAGLYPQRIDGVILVATGSPWREAFSGAMRNKVRFLIGVIPVCDLLLGYYPGARIGFGGNEARSVMDDWRVLARSNRYRASGLDQNLDARVAGYSGGVLAIRLADDAFVPPASIDAVTAKFVSARLTEKTLDAETIGDRADHMRWARTPAAVTQAVRDWIGFFV